MKRWEPREAFKLPDKIRKNRIKREEVDNRRSERLHSLVYIRADRAGMDRKDETAINRLAGLLNELGENDDIVALVDRLTDPETRRGAYLEAEDQLLKIIDDKLLVLRSEIEKEIAERKKLEEQEFV